MHTPSTILIIDDDEDVLDLLRYNLAREGYEVTCESNPRDAIYRCVKLQPDMVILDLMMPSINGFALCEKLRELKGFRKTPIFFLTAAGNARVEHEAYRVGADDFVHKILGLRFLVDKIELVLKQELIIRKRIDEFDVGKYHICRSEHTVTWKSRSVRLSREEFEIVYFLAQNAGKVISMQQLGKMMGSSSTLASIDVNRAVERLAGKFGDRWFCRRGPQLLQCNMHG